MTTSTVTEKRPTGRACSPKPRLRQLPLNYDGLSEIRWGFFFKTLTFQTFQKLLRNH